MPAARELVPTSNVPSRQTLACLGLCAAILIVAGIDLAHTESRLPDVSAARCESKDRGCFTAASRERLKRERRAEPLQDQYGSRSWLYAFAILAIGAVATANALRVHPRREWPRIFTNLGVIGVWAGIAAVVLLLLTGESSISVRAAPALVIPVTLLVVAAAGTLIGREDGWADESHVDPARDRVIHLGKLAAHIGTGGAVKRSKLQELGVWLSLAALSLTALTAVLAVVFIIPQPACGGGGGSPPAWTSPIDSIAAVTGIGAIAAGIGALVLRRWIAALISLAANPIALLLILASTCAFY